MAKSRADIQKDYRERQKIYMEISTLKGRGNRQKLIES